ncbi:hypothetical protein D5S17_30930 [Pseudonocardiaceae bacterium YIM PH 21723]|nr:hypothetical protein D5S17_30930 [Pseudonocardiaceae bacterium YIM PH 21723]
MKRTMRGLLAATAVMMTVSLAPGSIADPAPNNAPDALKQFNDLSAQAESVGQQINKVNEDIDAKKSDAEKAHQERDQAKATAEQAVKDQAAYRDQVDGIAAQAYTNGQMNSMGALLTAKDPGAMLNQMSMLDALAYNNKAAINALSGKVAAASEAEKKVADADQKVEKALKDTEELRGKLTAQKTELDTRKGQMKAAYDSLTKPQQTAARPPTAPAVPITGSDLGSRAASVAQQQLGKSYGYGDVGPNTFDCSGLTMFSYRAAGRPISRTTYTQVNEGVEVSKGQLQVGDLIFLGSDLHHVGMYLGGERWVHAPTTGDVVKIANVPWPQVSRMRHIQ